MSYKVSVDSVADAGSDDVLIAFIDIVFRDTTAASWATFGVAVLLPVGLSFTFWLHDHFLGAAILSLLGMCLVIGRILGMSRQDPPIEARKPEELEELQAQA